MKTSLNLTINQPEKTVQSIPIYTDCTWKEILALTSSYEKVIFFVDEHVVNGFQERFKGLTVIPIASGENSKDISCIMKLMEALLVHQVDRKSLLVGVGGGVVTDITGFLGSTFMRGVDFAFVPTTILAMVDACIGGKNGINIGDYKNMMGTIVQPIFLAYDYSFLKSLPRKEWVNGSAEMIKHACIADANLFQLLLDNTIDSLQGNQQLLASLIERNISIKCNIVAQDVREQGIRKMLNFGHTIAHGIEKRHNISHGAAVSIGMYYDCLLAQKIVDFRSTSDVKFLLEQYELPTTFPIHWEDMWNLIGVDKKVTGAFIDYILLENIGSGVIHKLRTTALKELLQQIN